MSEDDDTPVNLNARRAEATGDAREWTVVDLLGEALKESLEGSGWSKCVLLLYGEDDDGNFETSMRTAGTTTLETRGIIATGLKNELDD